MTLGRAFERLRGESQQVTVNWRFSADMSKEKTTQNRAGQEF